MKNRTSLRPAPSRVYWMGGGGGSAQTDAATQMRFNREAALLGQQLNRYNIVSPYGTQTFKGQTLVEALSPQQKKIFNRRQRADAILAGQAAAEAQRYGEFQGKNRNELDALAQSELGAATKRAGVRQNVLGTLSRTISRQFDPSAEYRRQGVEDIGSLDTNIEGFNLDDLKDVDRYGQREQDLGRKSVEEALFSRLNPQFDRDREALEARLAAQGVSPGSEAYIRDMDELRRASTDARFQAVLAGGQEQSRLEGLRQAELGRRLGVRGQELGFRGTELERRRALRQQLLEEQLARRRLPLDELAALEG